MPQATHDWRFATALSLTDQASQVAITLTRASSGWYFDSDGVLQEALTDIARFDHLPDGTSLGLRMETASTNSVTRSADFTHSDWTKTNTTITGDDAVAPDGNTAADKMQHTTNAGDIRQTTGLTSSGTLCFSIFVEKGNHQWHRMIISDGTNSVTGWFDTTNGVNGATAVVGTGVVVDSGIEDYDTYWRCWVSGNTVGAAAALLLTMNATADESTTESTATFSRIWGAQLEEQSFPTTPIPTVASAVTRAKDIASITLDTATHSGVIAARPGFGQPASGNYPTLWQTGVSTDYTQVFRNQATDTMFSKVRLASSTEADVNTGAVTDNTDFNIGFRFAPNDVNGTLDGTAATVDTAASLPTSTAVRIGNDVSSLHQWMGTIARIRIYSEALTDAELVSESMEDLNTGVRSTSSARGGDGARSMRHKRR